ncbi:LysM peptidoglycan-binding domain-containing protein [Melghirimyces algeriensis]|uniref:Stage VI sporulation protein D n=1 Tax=Melghirimyces algeriensis TaxID=910412 RepID=A0A521AR06_9BACL|nr:LysM peptidoglycan-binding domain-containing protein [Melghirimyces algeriensis]SMO37247.1 stage VI sporulation protein D [Melghirimyces algeriensis]
MTENSENQLRFDILEKVRLHPQQPGIQNMLDLDLYPDVEIEDQDTHLKIHGYLRLTGEYEGEQESLNSRGEEGKPEEIAYVIPVEITLPADRVDLDRISSEIQSFDYQVLSPFELQIEAVLTIDGLREEQPKQEVSDYEVVDRLATFSVSDSGRMEFEDSAEINQEDAEEENAEPYPNEYQFVHVARSDQDEEKVQTCSDHHPTEDEPNQKENVETEDSPMDEVMVADEKQEDIEENENDGRSADFEEQEKKVVLNPGKDEETIHFTDHFLRNPDQKEFSFQDQREAKDEFEDNNMEANQLEEEDHTSEDSKSTMEDNDQSEESEEKSAGTGLDWAKWIIKDPKEEFVKLRMVIVQKEDSLDSLADRYQVPASKILNMNQLESNLLEEGQIIYIPDSQ